jgi:superfamily II DNA/RNA helicase
LATKTKKKSQTSTQKIKPHILRDRLREKKVANLIRKVTGSQLSTEKTNKDPADKKGPSFPVNKKFAELNLMGPLLRVVNDLNFKTPTPVQQKTIKKALRSHNIIASAETGTGKTAAYGFPLLQRVHVLLSKERASDTPTRDKSAPLALVLCPTRELCEQVSNQIFAFAKYIPDVKILGLFGALKDINTQLREIEKGVDVLVATPGRLLTLIGRKKIKESMQPTGNQMKNSQGVIIDKELFDMLSPSEKKKYLAGELEVEAGDMKSEDLEINQEDNQMENVPEESSEDTTPQSNINLRHVNFLVLDEVDRMLGMGLFPDVRNIYTYLPKPNKGRQGNMQVVMMSATLMPRIEDLMVRFAPYHVKVDLNQDFNTAQNVKNIIYSVKNRKKYALLVYLLKRKGSMKGQQCLVFCRTKQRIERLVEHLKKDGFSAEAIHGDLTLSRRQNLVESFKEKQLQILVASDVMSRGIDYPDLPFVVNFDLPHLPEEFIHRIGRTGRAGRSGVAYTLLGSEAMLIKIGNQVVALNERDFLKKIENLMGKRLSVAPKVPGPWRGDEGDEGAPLDINPKVLYEAKEKVEKLLERQQHVVEEVEKQNKKRLTPQEKRAVNITKKKPEELDLRNFSEGRYEDLLAKFERKTALKKGVAVPVNFYDRLALREKQLKSRQMKKKMKSVNKAK